MSGIPGALANSFKTAGVVDALRTALDPLKKEIDAAFVYGSVVIVSKERPSSDIDLMLIGRAPLSRIAPLLRDVERQVGRPINPTVYGRDEFIKNMRQGNHFSKTGFKHKNPCSSKRGANELAKLVEGSTDKTAPNKSAGNRGSSRRR